MAARNQELTTAEWVLVFEQAAAMGIFHLHLTGGEPLLRSDLAELVAAAHESGLYVNLITSGIGLNSQRLSALVNAGLDHIQLSLQDSREDVANEIAGVRAHAKKIEVARMIRETELAFTVNIVVHRKNLDRLEELIAFAEGLGPQRIEIANVQYYGWALKNRASLLPTREQVIRSVEIVAEAKKRLTSAAKAASTFASNGTTKVVPFPEQDLSTPETGGAAEAVPFAEQNLSVTEQGRSFQEQTRSTSKHIEFVPPDYYSRFPKPCMGGWGRRLMLIDPAGRAMPCHAAGVIPNIQFDRVQERSLQWIWEESAAFNMFRGEDWMQEPCKTCPKRVEDFGGCRCQAYLIAGDAKAADPVCSLSPQRALIDEFVLAANAFAETKAVKQETAPPQSQLVYRISPQS
jgi:pyrroloquinoline quinone biosynthesis protein E